MKKHRPKFAYSGEDYIDRLEVSKALQIQESKSLNNSSKKHQDTITAIDREIEDCTSKTPSNPQQKEELRKLWKKEVSAATTTSERMVSDNIRYMKELPKTAPFTGFVELRQMSNGFFQAPRSAQDQDYRRDDQYTGDNGHQVNHDQRQRRYQQRNGYNKYNYVFNSCIKFLKDILYSNCNHVPQVTLFGLRRHWNFHPGLRALLIMQNLKFLPQSWDLIQIGIRSMVKI